MFRDTKSPIKKSTTVNVLIADGGVGDMVCTIPAIRSIKNDCPWINPLIWVPDYLVSFFQHFTDGLIVRSYTDAKTKYNDNLPGITTKWVGQHSPMRTHPVDYAFHQLLDTSELNIQKREYPKVNSDLVDLSKFNLPEKYAVVASTSVEKVKTFQPEVLNDISDYLISKGITPVYVGKREVISGVKNIKINSKAATIDYSKGLDLLDKTSLLELAAIIDKAVVFIGMDGGPVHIAGFTNTPIVAGYTFASPDHLMPIRHGTLGWKVYPVVPDESLKCRFCQTNWKLLYDHDFRNCFYDDFLCTKQMTSDKFIKQIENVFK